MGGKTCKPVVEPSKLPDLASKAQIAKMRSQFIQLAKSTDISKARIDKDVFLNSFLAPRFANHFGQQVLQRVLTVVCFEGNAASVGFVEFSVCYYVFHYGTRDNQLRFVFNCYDLSAKGEVDKKDFRKYSLMMMQTQDKSQKQTEMSDAKAKTLKAMVDMYMHFADLCFSRSNSNSSGSDDSTFSFFEWSNFAQEDDLALKFIDCMKGGDASSASSSSSSSYSLNSSSSSGAGDDDWTEILSG